MAEFKCECGSDYFTIEHTNTFNFIATQSKDGTVVMKLEDKDVTDPECSEIVCCKCKKVLDTDVIDNIKFDWAEEVEA